MLFYRVLIFYSVFYGLFVLASYAYPGLAQLDKPLTLLLWILFTPQAFEVAKGFAIISTRGMAFGYLSEEYVYSIRAKSKSAGEAARYFTVLVYAAMLLWAVGFILAVIWWGI